MKKIVLCFCFLLGLAILTGCGHSSASEPIDTNTVDSKPLKAEQTDLSNSTYTLKVRKDLDLVSSEIQFNEQEMTWTRTFSDPTDKSDKKTTETIRLTDIKITFKGANYLIQGHQGNEEKQIQFKKVGNYRIKDSFGNIYSI